MADTKITALTALTAADPANDVIPIVDVSDTSMAASGTTKKISVNNILGASGTATLASATITGDLTVDTSTLKVDSTNNRVIVGHTSGSSAFQVTNAGGAGLEIQPTGVNSAPVILSYNRSGSAYTQLTIDGASVVHNISGTTAMTLNSTGLGIGASPSYTLDIRKNAAGGRFISYHTGGNGTVTAATDLNEMRSDDTTTAYNLLNINVLGTSRFLVTSTGNVGIGVTPTGTRRLELKSAGTSNTTFAAHFRDSADTLLFHVRSDGYFNTGQGTLSPYSNTTASAANMFVDSSGFVYRSTSSLKYKTDVKDSIHGLADVLKLRSVTYKSKNGDDTVFGGLIAEEVHAAGLTEFVAYAPDKTPDSINYGNMVALLASAIQELTARVQTLEAR